MFPLIEPRASVLEAVDTYTQIHIEKHTKCTRATATPGFHRMHEVIPNKLLVSPGQRSKNIPIMKMGILTLTGWNRRMFATLVNRL